MKRFALLAALGLASACTTSEPPPPGTVTFYWRFQDYTGAIAGDYTTANPGCAEAGVTTVRVTIDQQTQDLNCVGSNGVPGIQFADFPTGSFPYTIIGFRGAEEIFADGGVVNTRVGYDTPVDATLTVEGTASSLLVYYAQNGIYSCAGTPWVAFELDDQFGNVVDLASYSANPALNTALVCDSSTFGFYGQYAPSGVTPTSLFPFGNYRFRYLSLLTATGAPQYQVCGYAFAHGGFTQPVNLPVDTAACP